MKLRIEISDEDAACLWDDLTWSGQQSATLEEILQRVIAERAADYKRAFPTCVEHAVERFRQMRNQSGT